MWPERRNLLAAVTLTMAFGVLVWPVVWTTPGKVSGVIETNPRMSELVDQTRYHEPAIRTFAETWPDVDLVDYTSLTAPGYHLALAQVLRAGVENRSAIQFLSSLMSLVLLLAFAHQVGRHTGPWAAVAVTTPLLGSSYFLGSSIWLTTDNTALLFVVLAVGPMVLAPATPPRLLGAGLWSAAAVFVRQIHLWTIAPLALTAILTTPLRRRIPTWLCPPAPLAERSWPIVLTAVVGIALPVAVVAWLISLWGGLVPPIYAELQITGPNPAAVPLALALTGCFGIFFLGIYGMPARGIGMIATVMIAVGVSLLARTDFDHEAGRWGGWVWELVRRSPSVGGRSILLVALAGMGGFVMANAFVAARRAGHGRYMLILVAAAAAWLAAQAANSNAWQRYYEPVILLMLGWAAALAISPGDRLPSRAWIGPLLLGGVQLAVSVVVLYRYWLGWT